MRGRGIGLIAILLLTGCTGIAGSSSASAPATGVSSAASSDGAPSSEPSSSGPSPLVGTTGPLLDAGSPGAGPTLVIEPTDGIAPVYTLISSARRTLDMTMYELVDPDAENLLAADASRGVTVRVILDGNNERAANTPAYAFLHAHGVHVAWSAQCFESTHQKTITVDGTTSAVMSLNLIAEDYPDTRDFAVLTKIPAQVAAIEATFGSDGKGTCGPAEQAPGLVWSPTQSTADLEAVIAAARHTLLVENEEMSSAQIVSALMSAQGRGVQVTVIMTDQTEWHHNFDLLVAAGVSVRVYAPNAALYIHSKALVADGAQAFVGSENFSTASLTRNRELGLVTTDPVVIAGLTSTLAADASGATAYKDS